MGPGSQRVPGTPDDERERESGSGRAEGAAARVRSAVKRRFRAHLGIDARALAAFRIGLGTVLLGGTLLRATNLRAFYTDAGVLPRSALAELYPVAESLSVHALFGSAEAQAVLFAVAAVAAICMIVGYRTTLATLVSLVLVLSVQGRNPLVLNGGDILLRHLLFWGVLLPLDERWAVDATRRSQSGRERVASLATAGILLQVLVVYGVNAVLKHRSDVWQDGTATEYIFHLDQYTVLLGDALAESPVALSVGGRLWFWLLTGCWLLVVLRGWPRAALVSAFVGAHLTMAATMSLDVFPFVSIVALLPFLPAVVWAAVDDRFVSRLEKRLPDVEGMVAKWQRLPSRPSAVGGNAADLARRYLLPAIAGLAILVMLAYNAGAVLEDGFGPTDGPDYLDGDPHWNMFAPNPPQTTNWNSVTGTLESGARVDALHGGSISPDRPPDEPSEFLSARWRKYFEDVRTPGRIDVLGPDLADYRCARWDATHETTLSSVTITHVTDPVDFDGSRTVHRRTIGQYECQN